MTGYISTAELDSKISASLVLGIVNDSVITKLEQYTDLCRDIISVDFLQRWLSEENNTSQILYFLRDLYLNKESLWLSYFYTEIEYDLIVYILHAAIIRLENQNFELKPQMVDKAYQSCKNEKLYQLLHNPSIELIDKICDCLIQSFSSDQNAVLLTSIMNDNDWRVSLKRVFNEKLNSYLPFLMSHTIFIINKGNVETMLIDQVEAKNDISDGIRDALRLTNSDIALVNKSKESSNFVLCEALCRLFTHCIMEMAEKKSELPSNYAKEVFYYLFTIVGLEHIQWFVSETFYSEIGKSLDDLRNKEGQ